MLDFLHIENVALIKQLDFDFTSGFTAMTGETGSGKSMIIDSINFVIGQRPNKDIIRNGENECYVYAVFSGISESVEKEIGEFGVDVDEDDTLTISRRYSVDGKSVSKINNRTVPISTVKTVASHLISINEQHESYSLLNDRYHINYLDAFSELYSLNHINDIDNYKNVFVLYQKAKNNLNDFIENAKEKENKLDFLKYQKNEIELAKIKVGEEEQLLSDRVLIKNSELISNAVKGSLSLLSGGHKPGAYDKLTSATDNIEKIMDMIPQGEILYNKCTALLSDMQEIIGEISGIDTGAYDDPTAALDKIEARLELISKIKSKYGDSEKEVLEYLEDISKQISDIEQYDFTLAEYEKEVKSCQEQAERLASQLHETRVKTSKNLCELINNEFQFLDMEKVKFDIDFKKLEELTQTGFDEVSFIVQTNPGENYKKLSLVASGGELSRIMLSLKKVLAACDDANCVIFDEIDTGVSGKTSSKIGISLKQLAKSLQVICITHSPQVSAIANTHLKVYKSEKDGRMFTSVRILDGEERISEIARILGGVTITENVLKTAEELIEQGKNI